MLTVHYAQSLDGRIATGSGDSQWIGGPESLRLAHRLRAEHHVVMVGVGTILADNPRLTVRLVSGVSPVRVILDSWLRTPSMAHVLQDDPRRTILATTRQADPRRIAAARALGVEVIRFDMDEHGWVDLAAVVRELENRRLDAILVEGGARVITSALRQGLVDRLVVCISAKLIGEGRNAVGDLGIHRLRDAITFSESRFDLSGDDVIFDGRPARVTSAVG